MAETVRNVATCVAYVGAKGDDRSGWVPSANVERQSTAAIGGAG